MKKKIISIITATLMFMGFGFTANAQETKSITPVILDVDMATDVDDATAVHAHWIDTDVTKNFRTVFRRCSNCYSEDFQLIGIKDRYCKFCEAKMDESVDE